MQIARCPFFLLLTRVLAINGVNIMVHSSDLDAELVQESGISTEVDGLKSLGREIMSPTQRMDTIATSVGKKQQRVSASASAIHVITQEDIRRSGVTSIPEALRMVPGVQVARIDSNKWAISARGFNGMFANKLLVLIDGREVYNPTFAGVYWDIQDLALDDIDRIEVIRGPGASLWGANAVNGVINILTKPAQVTQGGSLTAGGGSYEQGFGSLRYGAKLGDRTYGRVYAKGLRRGSFNSLDKGDGNDDWSLTQTGFRLDREEQDGNRLMLEGGIALTRFNERFLKPSPLPPYNEFSPSSGRASGFNLLGRWSKALSLSSEFSLQGYYDHFHRTERLATQERDTLDLEAQHRFLWGDWQDITWGLGYP